MDIQHFFKIGLSRDIPQLIPLPEGDFVGVDIGASGTKKIMPVCVGLPDWRWPRDNLPFQDDTVDVATAFHFLEHLSGEDAISMLREIERVLKPGGVVNVVVPYYNSSMQAHDLTHKSCYNESTFDNLFNCAYYDIAGNWSLKIHAQFIMGIVERNMALFAQLIKVE